MPKTLPREIIKWIQSLDLSYSYKDSRRDLNNGFLIAEILARYFPNRLSMHSFDMSNNTTKKNNNWFLLAKFFKKYNLPFKKETYQDIPKGDFDQLVTFMMALYETLTKRTINQNMVSLNLQAEPIAENDNTETYLLTNKGLEKLDIQKEISINPQETGGGEEKDKKATIKEKSDDDKDGSRGQSRGNYDPRELNRMRGRKETVTSRDFNAGGQGSINASFTESNVDGIQRGGVTDGPPEDKDQTAYVNINIQLNEVIEDILENDPNDPDFEDDRLLVDYSDKLMYQIYAENINHFSDNFNQTFIEELVSSSEEVNNIEQLAQLLIRDVNELWKFMYFLFACLKNVNVRKECFPMIVDMIRDYNDSFMQKDPIKFNAFFREMFVNEFVNVYKSCATYEKKIHTIKLLYTFFRDTYEDKHEAIRLFKFHLKNQGLFIQGLGILITLETSIIEENTELIKDFQFYAKYAIGSRQASLKISGFALMSHLAELDFRFVQKEMMSFLGSVRYSDWWELRIMYLIVMSKVLRELVASGPYQVFVKKNTQNLGKNIQADGELLVKNIKDLFARVSNSFRDVVCKNINEDVTKIALIYFSDLISESKTLASVYIDLLLQTSPKQRNWALYEEEEDEYEEERYFILSRDSRKYRTHINTEFLKQASGDILTELSRKLKNVDGSTFGMNYIDILIFALENAEFDKLNVEILDGLINNSLDLLLNALNDKEMCQQASQILEKYMETFLKGEALISEFDQKLGDSIAEVFNRGEEYQVGVLKNFLRNWSEDYNEESTLYEQFNKIVSRIVRKSCGKITEEDNKKWLQEMFEMNREGQDFVDE